MTSNKIEKRRYFGYRSFMPEYETMKKFRAMGIDTFTFMVSNNNNMLGLPYTKYQPTWTWEREYDFALFDKNVEDILESVPDAKLICFIDLNPPEWWARRGNNRSRFDPFTDLGKVASSTEWRDDTVHYLQALLRHAEAKHKEHLTAYVIAGGKTTEWFDISCGEESIPRLEGFRNYMRACGKAIPQEIPPKSVRYNGSHDTDNIEKAYNQYDRQEEFFGIYNEPSGMFRTPQEDELALDYWKFNNKQVADAVEHFIKKAREVLPAEKELGVCFGYMEMGQYYRASLGHLEYERIFQMPELDFALEPMAYNDRLMGGASATIIPPETLRVNGKRLLCSCDHATYTKRFPLNFPGSVSAWKDAEEVKAGIKREFAFNLINGNSTWWFDMWGGWWDSPEAMNTIKRSKEIWDEEILSDEGSAAEILFVVDPQNIYYINDSRCDCAKFDVKVRTDLNRIGAPHAFASFNDLNEMDLSSFKLIVMCHPFELGAKKMSPLQDKVFGNGRTILWIYGPGIINNGKWDPANVHKICGTDYKTPGVNPVDMGGWTSLYIHDTDIIDTPTMREIAEKAGCHMYCDKPRPACASEHLLSIHTGEAEELNIRLKKRFAKVTELYTGQVFKNTDSITLKTDSPDTFLFRCE